MTFPGHTGKGLNPAVWLPACTLNHSQGKQSSQEDLPLLGPHPEPAGSRWTFLSRASKGPGSETPTVSKALDRHGPPATRQVRGAHHLGVPPAALGGEWPLLRAPPFCGGGNRPWQAGRPTRLRVLSVRLLSRRSPAQPWQTHCQQMTEPCPDPAQGRNTRPGRRTDQTLCTEYLLVARADLTTSLILCQPGEQTRAFPQWLRKTTSPHWGHLARPRCQGQLGSEVGVSQREGPADQGSLALSPSPRPLPLPRGLLLRRPLRKPRVEGWVTHWLKAAPLFEAKSQRVETGRKYPGLLLPQSVAG